MKMMRFLAALALGCCALVLARPAQAGVEKIYELSDDQLRDALVVRAELREAELTE